VPPEDVDVGLRVRVQFHDVGPDVTLPYFTADEADSS
jgi:hypothetical protein